MSERKKTQSRGRTQIQPRMISKARDKCWVGFQKYYLYETVVTVMINLEACSKQVINKIVLCNNKK